MFGCAGNGVWMPLLGLVGVGSWPVIDTQAYVSAQRPLQLLPALGFHAKNSASVMPLAEAMLGHDSPGFTRWNLSQLLTISGCVGCGVAILFNSLTSEPWYYLLCFKKSWAKTRGLAFLHIGRLSSCRLSSCWLRIYGSRCACFMANNGDAGVGFGPQASAVHARIRVPFCKLGCGDTVSGRNWITAISWLDKIEFVTVAGNIGLSGLRSLDPLKFFVNIDFRFRALFSRTVRPVG